MSDQKTNPALTVLTISVGFGIMHLVIDQDWPLYVSLGIGVSGLISHSIRKGIDFIWMKMALVLSFIMPNILLSLIYFIVLVPLAIVSQLFLRNDPLNLKNNSASLFKDRNHVFEKADFEKMW